MTLIIRTKCRNKVSLIFHAKRRACKIQRAYTLTPELHYLRFFTQKFILMYKREASSCFLFSIPLAELIIPSCLGINSGTNGLYPLDHTPRSSRSVVCIKNICRKCEFLYFRSQSRCLHNWQFTQTSRRQSFRSVSLPAFLIIAIARVQVHEALGWFFGSFVLNFWDGRRTRVGFTVGLCEKLIWDLKMIFNFHNNFKTMDFYFNF